MELTFRTAGIGDLELLTESRLRAIRTYRHLSETAALPHGLPDAVRDYYRQALASGSHIALLALVGERHTRPIREGLLAEGFDETRIFTGEKLEDALQFAYGIREQGHKYILLENDLPDNY